LIQNNKSINENQPFVSRVVKVRSEDRWLVQSAKNPREYYSVTLEGCECKGFEYRKQCRHIQLVYEKIQNEIEGEYLP
jgi:hypothetical protein